MHLVDILDPTVECDVLLVYNKSSKYFNLTLNLLKKKFGVANGDTLFLTSIAELKNNRELLATNPLMSDYWLLYLEDCKGISTELMEIILASPSVKLLIGVKNYRDFIKLRSDRRWSRLNVETAFGSSMTREEFMYVYEATTKVKGSSKLDDMLLEFVQKRYLREPEEVFELLSALKTGITFNSKHDIVNLIGVGNLSIEFEALSLITSTVKTERGLKGFLKRHSGTLLELSHRTNPRAVYNGLLSSFKALLDVKQLLREGLVLAGVSTTLDIEVYDTPRVRKLLPSASSLESIPTSKIVLAISVLTESPTWEDDLDVLGFVNNYIYKLFDALEVKI